MIGSQVRLFEMTERRLPSFAPHFEKDVRAYVDSLKACMRGNLDWSAETYRYLHVAPSEGTGYLEDLLSTGAETDIK
jgi:hypothetical protein